MNRTIITRLSIIGYFIFVVIYMNFNSFFDRIECPFYKITKIPCAGCGATRAFKSILQGNIKNALYYNILAVIAFPILIVALFSPAILKLLEKPPFSLIIILIVVIFFVIRAILKFQV